MGQVGGRPGGWSRACCAGLTGGVRKTQHEEAGNTASGCQRVEGVAKRTPGSQEPWGPSEEPVESTTTSHVQLTARPMWEYSWCKNPTPPHSLPPLPPKRGLKSQLLCKEEVARREQRAEELHTHFLTSEMKPAKVEEWRKYNTNSGNFHYYMGLSISAFELRLFLKVTEGYFIIFQEFRRPCVLHSAPHSPWVPAPSCSLSS